LQTLIGELAEKDSFQANFNGIIGPVAEVGCAVEDAPPVEPRDLLAVELEVPRDVVGDPLMVAFGEEFVVCDCLLAVMVRKEKLRIGTRPE